MIRLNELFALLHIDCEDARILQGISDDTRDVKKDWLFVCRKGSLYDGAAFLQEALDKGAVVLCDQMLPMQHVYYTPHVERITQALLELYYGDLCTRLHADADTGMLGKVDQLLHIAEVTVVHNGSLRLQIAAQLEFGIAVMHSGQVIIQMILCDIRIYDIIKMQKADAVLINGM